MRLRVIYEMDDRHREDMEEALAKGDFVWVRSLLDYAHFVEAPRIDS